jgi:myosin-5
MHACTQLDAMVQKIFPMIRNMVKREITPMLANCIHVPKSALRSRTLAAAPNGEGHAFE